MTFPARSPIIALKVVAALLKQLTYFQSVVRNGSFSKAAEECFISQSAISQQVQALEKELGVELLRRKGRRFSLTPAGESFYQKSFALTEEWDKLCREVRRLDSGGKAQLRLGCLQSFAGPEFHQAVQAFAERYPHVELHPITGSHEDLYLLLISGQADLLLSDQRRAFSEGYYNEVLAVRPYQAELAARHPIAQREAVGVEELEGLPCILISSPEQRDAERDYYRDMVGLRGGFLYAGSLEEGRLLAVSGKGFLLLEGAQDMPYGPGLRRVPLLRHGRPLPHNYCAFWNRDNSGYYVEEFARMLKEQFEGTE